MKNPIATIASLKMYFFMCMCAYVSVNVCVYVFSWSPEEGFRFQGVKGSCELHDVGPGN